MLQLPCLGRSGKCCTRLLSISQTVSLVERGQELPSVLAINYPPRLCIAQRMLHAWYWLCSGGYQLYSPASRLEQCWASLLPGVVTRSSDWTGLEDAPHSRSALIQLFAGYGKLDFRAGKTPPLKIQIRQICTLLISLVRMCLTLCCR